jgi:hypothetical protein
MTTMCAWLQSKNGNTVEVDLTSSLADIVVEPIRTGKASSHRNERLSKVTSLSSVYMQQNIVLLITSILCQSAC